MKIQYDIRCPQIKQIRKITVTEIRIRSEFWPIDWYNRLNVCRWIDGYRLAKVLWSITDTIDQKKKKMEPMDRLHDEKIKPIVLYRFNKPTPIAPSHADVYLQWIFLAVFAY